MSASISLSIADSPSSGNDECAARPAACSLTRSMPRVAIPRRLSVGSPSTRKRQSLAARFAARAPSLPRSSPTTNSSPTRPSPPRRRLAGPRRTSSSTTSRRFRHSSRSRRRTAVTSTAPSRWATSSTRPSRASRTFRALLWAVHRSRRASSTRCSATEKPRPRRYCASQRPASVSRPVVESMSTRARVRPTRSMFPGRPAPSGLPGRSGVTESTPRAPSACRFANRGT